MIVFLNRRLPKLTDFLLLSTAIFLKRNFRISLKSAFADITSPDIIQSFNSTKDIEDVIDALNSVIKSSALKSKLAFHPSRIPAKMLTFLTFLKTSINVGDVSIMTILFYVTP